MKSKDMGCICGKTAKYVRHLTFNHYDISGWKCSSCGEEYYDPVKAEKILLINKLRKHSFHIKLSQIRSNLIIRVPKLVGDALNLHKGEEVEFGLRGDEIVIRPRTR